MGLLEYFTMGSDKRAGAGFEAYVVAEGMPPKESLRTAELTGGQLACKETVRTDVNRSVSEGPNRVIRAGGGTRTAVLPLDLDNPHATFAQLATIAQRRRAVL